MGSLLPNLTRQTERLFRRAEIKALTRISEASDTQTQADPMSEAEETILSLTEEKPSPRRKCHKQCVA